MLVGRQAERDCIARVLAQARRGKSGVVLVVGEAGMGKSALLGHAVELSAGMRLLRARGIESEAAIPFAGLLELLRPVGHAIDRIPTSQVEALRGALGLGAALGSDRFMIGAATLSVLAEVAEETPLLVAVDDAHWLDEESLAALAFAVRRLEFDAVATVIAFRDGDCDAFEGTGFRRLRLRSLDREACSALANATLGHAIAGRDAEHLYRLTAGNPLAIIELAHAAGSASTTEPSALAQLPESTLERVFAQRIGRLSQSAQRVLLVAAIDEAGEMRIVAPAARALNVDPAALEEAEAADLVALGDGRVVFRHPLARSAVARMAPPGQRRAAHTALADALGPAEGLRRAWHLAAATLEPDETVADALERAAGEARARGGYASASSALARAAALTPSDGRRSRRLFAAAEAAWLAGHSATAGALADDALRFCDDDRLLTDLRYLRGHIALETGRLDEALAILLSEGFDASPGEPAKAALIMAETLQAAMYAGRRHRADRDTIAIARAAGELARSADPRAAFWATFARGWALLETDQEREGRRLLAHAQDAVSEHQLADDAHLLAWAAVAAGYGGDFRRAVELSHRSVDLSRRVGAVGTLPLALSVAADYDFCTGTWTRSLAEADEGRRIALEVGQASEALFCSSTMMIVLAARGDGESVQHAAQVRALADQFGMEAHTYDARSLGLLALGRGAPEEAIARLEPIINLYKEQSHHVPPPGDGFDLVEAYVRAGRPDSALEAITRLERSSVQPYSLGALARCRGLTASESDFAESFLSSLVLLEPLGLPFHVARTRLCYGERLRRAGQRVDARRQLAAALEIFERLGAHSWAERAETELRASGERLKRRKPTDREELTPQELQIALIVAGGKTNKEVGAALFLSPKTIETHLSRIYRKLGITSRAQLIHALSDDDARTSS